MKAYYVTTAIDYANGSPHLGHAYEKVLTDVIARIQRLQGESVHFLTGLDEHGQKVQQGAQRNGLTPQEACDRTAVEFKKLCRDLQISNDDYIRTTEPRHKEVVQQILTDFYDRGEIYKADYKGYYSTRQEQFLLEKDKVDGKWPEIFGEVIEMTESNYFFRLSKYQDWLIDYLKTNENFIFPKFRTKQVLEFLKEPINDLCISRPKERLSWGIPLPFDSNYVTYVWFDALINYISAIEYGKASFNDKWPADFHVIGKDILLPAHAVYWPIMLHAANIALPKCLLVHGWWLKSGEKMSKSQGNCIDPLQLIEKVGVDAFRYFVMREMNVGQDSDFSSDLFLTRYHSDLGNDLGNLVSRFLNMTERYADRKIPAAAIDEDLEKEIKNLWSTTEKDVQELLSNLQFHIALEKIFTFVRGINRYAEQRAPWKLAKSTDPIDKQRLETSLATMAEGLRLAATLLTPFIPSSCKKILNSLGANEITSWKDQFSWDSKLTGNSIGEKFILYPRVEDPV
ncbi:MAG: methionine--tRNA ligase [Verrucomicrobia bacterium GWC2_42_7]|nr:MAG: methionine--tRNA ligase [Verrucomicrobia bacterium GWC2_42_7]